MRMDQQEPQFIEVGQGPKRRRIAYRFEDRGGDNGVVLVWLSGFLSDMAGTKVMALGDWARREGHAMLSFDYSGHGLSDGTLLEATIGDWVEEATAILDLMGAGPIVFVGSSMGGWIALLVARVLAQRGDTRLAGLVLIAPAWDMTETLIWAEASPEQRAAVERDGVFYAPSNYTDPYPITRHLIEEGRNHLIGESIEVGAPVRILQGMRDPDVPWRHALALVDRIAGGDVELTLIKDVEHRMSEPEDLRRLEHTIDALIGAIRTRTA
jgi:pimeloyl-ACP methyl ester carboxylesterase